MGLFFHGLFFHGFFHGLFFHGFLFDHGSRCRSRLRGLGGLGGFLGAATGDGEHRQDG